MSTVSSAERVCSEPLSSGATTATVATPSSRHVRKMRSAISPRLATRSLRIVIRKRDRPRKGLSLPLIARRSDLLPRVEEVLRVEGALHRGVQVVCTRTELPFEPRALDCTNAVLPGDCAAVPQRDLE